MSFISKLCCCMPYISSQRQANNEEPSPANGAIAPHDWYSGGNSTADPHASILSHKRHSSETTGSSQPSKNYQTMARASAASASAAPFPVRPSVAGLAGAGQATPPISVWNGRNCGHIALQVFGVPTKNTQNSNERIQIERFDLGIILDEAKIPYTHVVSRVNLKEIINAGSTVLLHYLHAYMSKNHIEKAIIMSGYYFWSGGRFLSGAHWYNIELDGENLRQIDYGAQHPSAKTADLNSTVGIYSIYFLTENNTSNFQPEDFSDAREVYSS